MTIRPRSPGQKRTLDSLRRLPLTPSVSAYLESRGLLEVATDLEFGAVPDSPPARLARYAGRLVIPSIGPHGNVYDVAFRCVRGHDCKEAECPKYLFLDELDKRLYNLRAIARAGDTLDVVEGQLDAATLEACGLHAVGVAGGHGWKRHHHRLLTGFPRIRVWGDGDVAGKDFAKNVAHDLSASDVMMVPWGEDVNSVYVKQGRDAILKIAEGETDDEEDDGWEYDSEQPPF